MAATPIYDSTRKTIGGEDHPVIARFAPPAEPGSNEIRDAVAEALAE